MSNAIRYDALLVRELARELDVALTGARVDAVYFDRERLRLTLRTRAARRAAPPPPSLLWQLHPAAGHLTHAPDGAGTGRAQLPAGARIAAVSAPPDERLLFIDLAGDDAAGGAVRRIVVELMSNQWNAIATGADGRIVALLRERETAGRMLRAGAEWTAPPRSGRAGANGLTPAEWQELLGPVPAAERLRALPRLLAWASPQNATWILGRAGIEEDSTSLEQARQRHARLVGGPLYPALLQEEGRWQPYVTADAFADSGLTLLQAFALAAERAHAVPEAPAVVEEALGIVAERMEAVEKRLRRLQEELKGSAASATRLRQHADLLLSQLHRVRRGAASVQLDDFAGGSIEVELDPTLGPADNATRIYDAARRRDRAAARIPRIQDAARAELLRLEALAARLRDGTAEPAELERLRAARPLSTRDAPPRLPYRLYRTSGGLEVRVGRGSRANDELTFRHSSPSDIWLHARDVAGAHVILRWTKTQENPPARDIAEAAVLAALHSRARTSGAVPVDWTRRKYVRKPRKAGPGLVLPERVRTVFVEPDAELEARLREETL